MKMNKLTLAVLALAAAGFASQSVRAASSGDLILAFRDTTNNTGENLEFDLGSASTFNFAASNPDVLNASTDLNSIFGNGGSFTSDTNLTFTVAGALTSNPHPIYFSDPGNQANPFKSSTTTADATDINKIYAGFTAGTTLADGGLEIAASNASSYSNVIRDVDGTPYSLDFNFITSPSSTEVALSSSQPWSLTLYKDTPNTQVDEGTFTLGTNGVLAYTVAPEPSTYALMALSGLVVLFVRRRMLQA